MESSLDVPTYCILFITYTAIYAIKWYNTLTEWKIKIIIKIDCTVIRWVLETWFIFGHYKIVGKNVITKYVQMYNIFYRIF